ncbi:pheromone A receptor domain-containing protein [Hirsutella rhossiliensis]|uniref:Pheromone A receptor domain-containing protein n=1 Tax=Hirsutella rhossiliensis TaxID=111463 RepID=A0A9P8SLZ9_9HYPO|nr:pheromone A receptor domain-containing protein [Hirsutella rhossiliensis]KAH0966814.1 pheromone A receptor domain-containing protein [Hirsutella rhossiliensis]
MESSSISLFARAGTTAVLGTPLPPPYTTPSLTANLVLRVTLSLLANIVCLVPLRVLHRNGEFAAAVFIANVELLNLETTLNSLLWRNDHVARWWAGWGFCDAVIHFHNAATALYITCLLAIMRNLAQQVGLMRANPLTGSERMRRNLVQALIMFPLPVVQVAWTRAAAARRYEVGTLVGCTWSSHSSWPNLAFFILPPAVVAIITSGFAVLTYIRFRQIAKTTESALSSSRRANRRSQRTKRRLYMMVMSIVVPYLPVVIGLAIANVLEKPGRDPWDYNAIHHGASPLPWSTVALYPSTEINWASMNNCYISVLTAIPVFLFFGTTKDAVNEYRIAALFLGLDRLFPRLRNEYDPSRTPRPGGSLGSSQTATFSDSPSSMGKTESSGSARHLNGIEHTLTTGSQNPHVQAIDFATLADPERGQTHDQPPAPSCSAEDRTYKTSAADLGRHRNPFPFRTRLNFPIPLRFPFLARRASTQPMSEPNVPLGPLRPASSLPQWNDPAGSMAQVAGSLWPDDEARLFNTSPVGNNRDMPQMSGRS